MSPTEANSPLRRRGRPRGKNRVPLTNDQRRARNASYERQRRQEQSIAMAALAEAVGCTSNTQTAALLEAAIRLIQLSKKKEPIDYLMRRTELLKAQIADMENEAAKSLTTDRSGLTTSSG